jgi:hypothetical protein
MFLDIFAALLAWGAAAAWILTGRVSVPESPIPGDRQGRDEQHAHDGAAPDAVHSTIRYFFVVFRRNSRSFFGLPLAAPSQFPVGTLWHYARWVTRLPSGVRPIPPTNERGLLHRWHDRDNPSLWAGSVFLDGPDHAEKF